MHLSRKTYSMMDFHRILQTHELISSSFFTLQNSIWKYHPCVKSIENNLWKSIDMRLMNSLFRYLFFFFSIHFVRWWIFIYCRLFTFFLLYKITWSVNFFQYIHFFTISAFDIQEFIDFLLMILAKKRYVFVNNFIIATKLKINPKMIENSWFMVSIDLDDDGKNICTHQKSYEKKNEWKTSNEKQELRKLLLISCF